MIDMIKRLKIADAATIGNLLSGFIAIICAIQLEFQLSVVFALSSVLFDYFDGKIARWRKETDEFGKQLDSLADIVSFGVWPAVFGFAQGLSSIFAIAVFSFFIACGMLRLARYNVIRVQGFLGVPITTNGILFPLLYFIFGQFNQWMLIGYGLMGILMISTIKVPKL
jgi:CDP-diacylglycerol---serine O-phosphatidyltransferase